MTEFAPIEDETPIAPSHLVDHSITTRSELARREAENIRRPIVKYLSAKPTRRRAPFTCKWMLELNREMFGDIWTWAGQTRTINLNIGIDWKQVVPQLYDFEGDLASWRTNAPFGVLEQSVHLHHRAVAIHPFLNGNGRWSRLLSNIWLAQNDYPIVAWPETDFTTDASPIRGEYIAACKSADHGDCQPLLELHRAHLE